MGFVVLDRLFREIASASCPLDALAVMKANHFAECVVRIADGEVIGWRDVLHPVSMDRWYRRLQRSVA